MTILITKYCRRTDAVSTAQRSGLALRICLPSLHTPDIFLIHLCSHLHLSLILITTVFQHGLNRRNQQASLRYHRGASNNPNYHRCTHNSPVPRRRPGFGIQRHQAVYDQVGSQLYNTDYSRWTYTRHASAVVDINNRGYGYDTGHKQMTAIPVYILRVSWNNKWTFFRVLTRQDRADRYTVATITRLCQDAELSTVITQQNGNHRFPPNHSATNPL
jgi:hypothetical protein